MKDRDPAAGQKKRAQPQTMWSEEARRAIQEYIDDLREIARNLRRRLR